MRSFNESSFLYFFLMRCFFPCFLLQSFPSFFFYSVPLLALPSPANSSLLTLCKPHLTNLCIPPCRQYLNTFFLCLLVPKKKTPAKTTTIPFPLAYPANTKHWSMHGVKEESLVTAVPGPPPDTWQAGLLTCQPRTTARHAANESLRTSYPVTHACTLAYSLAYLLAASLTHSPIFFFFVMSSSPNPLTHYLIVSSHAFPSSTHLFIDLHPSSVLLLTLSRSSVHLSVCSLPRLLIHSFTHAQLSTR